MTDSVPDGAEVSPSLGDGVPERLQRRVDELFREHGVHSVTPADATRVARLLLDSLVADAAMGRPRALDLLSVDALVTRAIEVCASDPDSLEEEIARSIRELRGGERA